MLEFCDNILLVISLTGEIIFDFTMSMGHGNATEIQNVKKKKSKLETKLFLQVHRINLTQRPPVYTYCQKCRNR